MSKEDSEKFARVVCRKEVIIKLLDKRGLVTSDEMSPEVSDEIIVELLGRGLYTVEELKAEGLIEEVTDEDLIEELDAEGAREVRAAWRELKEETGLPWGAVVHREGIRNHLDQYDHNNQIRLLAGSILPAQAHQKAVRLRHLLRQQILDALEKVDVLVMPTS